MGKLELSQVVLRRMKEEDINIVKELIKEGSHGSENRLILYLLTRPLALLLLAIASSILRCLLHSFILALVLPVFVVIIYLKLTIPRTLGILGTSKHYWDYIGSSYRGPGDCMMENPCAQRKEGKTGTRMKAQDKGKCRQRGKSTEMDAREREAGEVWLAVLDGEIIGCIALEGRLSEDICRVCRLVVQCWYRKEGLGRLLVESVERQEKALGRSRMCAHVPVASKVAMAFFQKLGYCKKEDLTEGELEGDKLGEMVEERSWMGFPVNRVFVKDLCGKE
ncbi:probable N-acetyltransferase 14 [Brienomyrus brachyistius]|uniref:probable N-acetyltransferase 14 n=1 Tax=Brienomyrus brachyistius TaxID=42636 RepID=UPI0020B378E0|nr:probable N-acetyltransferase 14 [Brienomyrus brachyistius]XP_048881747.1 probable N-acetyltransferase 14 [Brienomyrus brachyistius]